MKVLFVAPRTDLLLADEEAQDVLRSGLDVTPLLGRVSSIELIREIKTGDYDVLWLATHGVAERNVLGVMKYGIQLSDGILAASELVAQVRGKFNLVYLNSCTSWHIAQQIQEDANVTVIGTIVDVPDRQAYVTGSLFASALADGLTPQQAYKRSKPGGERVYVYLAALESSEQNLDNLLLEMRKLNEKVDQGTVKDAKARQLLRMLLWVSLGIHVPEWIALVWLGMLVLGR